MHNAILLFGTPGGAEWILIIIALATVLAPLVAIIYLLKKSINRKNEHERATGRS